MTRTKFIALFVAVVGSFLYVHSYLNPPETWESHNKKGVNAFQQSRYAEAEKHFVQALKLAGTPPLSNNRLHFSLHQLAEIYRIQSKFVEAELILKRTLAMDEQISGPEHANVAFALNNLAANYRVRGKYEEAEVMLQRALKILEESLGREHPMVGNILEHYAHLLHKMGRSIEAEKLETRFQAIYSASAMENQ
ncbi:MAG: tetratricopeptide repeat protein [Nitrospinae bacterium]|nr:tetratricopeptide repeat protein [Nitrospinota bacterium]MBL7019309.1 tetratricopeptide repeat protein [Nitrospinaceae bacterium]